jgi:hypothetical protein
MENFKKFLAKNFTLIVFIFLVIGWFKGCGDTKEIGKINDEIKAIKAQGGIVIRVKRGEDPAWYNDAADVNYGDRCMNYSRAKSRMEALRIHASETAWVGTKFDAVIDNNGSIEDLYSQIKNLASSPRDAKAA